MNRSKKRSEAAALIELTAALLRGAGAEADKAAVVAEPPIEADLIGHTTHGLHLCAPYLFALDERSMRGRG